VFQRTLNDKSFYFHLYFYANTSCCILVFGKILYLQLQISYYSPHLSFSIKTFFCISSSVNALLYILTDLIVPLYSFTPSDTINTFFSPVSSNIATFSLLTLKST